MIPRLVQSYVENGKVFYTDEEFNKVLSCADNDFEMANLLAEEICVFDEGIYGFIILLNNYNCIRILRTKTIENYMKPELYKYIMATAFVLLHASGYIMTHIRASIDIIMDINYRISKDIEYLKNIVEVFVTYYQPELIFKYHCSIDEYDSKYHDIPESIMQTAFDTLIEDVISKFIAIVKLLKILDIYGHDPEACQHTLIYLFDVYTADLCQTSYQLETGLFNDSTWSPVVDSDNLIQMIVIYYSTDTLRSANNYNEVLSDIARRYIYNR